MNRKPYSPAISLIELLISLSLASLMFSFLTHYYWKVQTQYQYTQKHLEQTLDIHLILQLLSYHLAHVGYTPCASSHLLDIYDPQIPARTLQALTWQQQPFPSLSIRGMNPYYGYVTHIHGPNSVQIYFPWKTIIAPQMLITDCVHAEIINVTPQRHQQRLQFTTALHYTYHSPIYIGAWEELIFSIKTPKTPKRTHHQKPGLWLQTRGHNEYLSSLIQDFQIKKISEQPFTLQIIFSLAIGQKLPYTLRFRETP
ncbi:MAG: hypothetical protein Q8R79_08990 [Legionellaceae bacterium]|nr:hypothetical protein [Legionellaceae bacterium]